MNNKKVFDDVTCIKINVIFEGRGCINYDQSSQMEILKALGMYDGDVTDNIRPSKKVFYKDGFHHIVSSDCIRHNLFCNNTITNQKLQFAPTLLYRAITSIPYLVRGYMFTANKKPIRRKTTLCITDAEEIGEKHNVVNLGIHSKMEQKSEDNKSATDPKSTNLYSKEHIGHIEYDCEGYMDLTEGQFISADILYDRDGVGMGVADDDADTFFNKGAYIKSLNENLGENGVPADYKYGYYYIKNCIVADELGERGILLNQKDVNRMVRFALTQILTLLHSNNGAFIRTKSLKITVYNARSIKPVEIELTTLDEIEGLTFNYHQKYFKTNEERIIANRRCIDEARAAYNQKRAEEKAEKDKKKAEAKKKATIPETTND